MLQQLLRHLPVTKRAITKVAGVLETAPAGGHSDRCLSRTRGCRRSLCVVQEL